MAASSLVRRRVLTDFYPVNSSIGSPKIDWEPCVLQVLDTRDLVTDPLTVEEFMCDPLQRISRFAYTVEDLESFETRTVYQRVLKSNFRECPIRVGVFRGSKMVNLFADNWGTTIDERRDLVQFLQLFEGENLGDLKLGVFSDDGESIKSGLLAVKGAC